MTRLDTPIHTEKAFEEAIESSLIENGSYEKGDAKKFDPKVALNPEELFIFLECTQSEELEKLKEIHGSEWQKQIISRLCKELEIKGMLDVLRNGITDHGTELRLAYFKPESGLNPETQKLYDCNKLTITRQVHYSEKFPEKSIDILLSLNGLPIATIELKNQFTGQNVNNAQRQYRDDRDPRELIFEFKKRTLVHFAVDTDLVYMTTKLNGEKTYYLPFNKGQDGGAGNPPCNDEHRSAYLWKEILVKDSWMDVLGRFLHLQKEEHMVDGKKYTKETLIFPRYHQLDVVRRAALDAKKIGVGKNYLVQHSAGSGKSNSIAWLAYRLSGLHNEKDEKIFNTIIVISDRRVLDQQLQNTIYQFEHKTGVVVKVDKGSKQLAEALKSGSHIIITTLQKFPFAALLDEVHNLPERRYAIIVDEAHSSQGGEATTKMKELLGTLPPKSDNGDDLDTEDIIRMSIEAKGQQPNLSFFAFTATPKPKTLEFFGTKDKTGKPKPFHLYSMRQAIEEGFIHDVLKNYTTYKTYFRLNKEIEEDPELNKRQANKAIARFVSLHPHNLAQKTEVIIEHFRHITSKKIGGQAKAMVVTSSRLHAVRYYHEFKRYLEEKKYSEIKPLVAFSGKVKDDDGAEYTEVQLNGFSEKELPERFSTREYQILLVAEKYQTGFDQPLLHTMYVDKKLSGIKAVQTLSRVNRTCPGKEDTFILDFANTAEEIAEAFQEFYEMTSLTETADPNHMYDLKNRLDATHIYLDSEVEAFCTIFFQAKKKQNKQDHARLNGHIDPAVDRFTHLETPEQKEDFKSALQSFVRLYNFLCQIMPFQDEKLEKLATYGRFLLMKLPKEGAERYKLDDEVAMEYYRLQKIADQQKIELEKAGVAELEPVKDAGLRKEKDIRTALSDIIKLLNDRFGTELTEADRLFFDQVEEELSTNETLRKQSHNPIENFKFSFDDVFISAVIDRLAQNQELGSKIMNEKGFGEAVREALLKRVYERLNSPSA